MTSSRLVTPGGVRRHTVRGIRKITKAAIAGGTAALALAGAVGVAAPAQARTAQIVTVVSWDGGGSCLDVRYASGILQDCGPLRMGTSRGVRREYSAASGQTVGADPIMGSADRISCTLWVNGNYEYSDTAYAGDGHDANCLRVLN